MEESQPSSYMVFSGLTFILLPFFVHQQQQLHHHHLSNLSSSMLSLIASTSSIIMMKSSDMVAMDASEVIVTLIETSEQNDSIFKC